MIQVEHIYKDHLKAWPRAAGRKPIRELKKVHAKRLAQPGTKNAIAAAMAMRPQGATHNQIQRALGSRHYNKLRQITQKPDVSFRPVIDKKGHVGCKITVK